MNVSAARVRGSLRILVSSAALASLGALSGCFIPAAIGGMAESYQRTGTTTYAPEYEGLSNKSFAIVCTMSRTLEAGNPGLSSRITQRINDRLIQNANGSHAIPSRDLLQVLYNTPHWPALTREELANMLGVQRLVVIEIIEYRLNEPGNRHLWDGRIAGVVSVFESDSALPNDPIYEKAIAIQFPDSTGYLRSDIPEAAVTTELSNRFINRASWLFYEHEEPNVIPY